MSPVVACVSSGLLQRQGLWLQQTWETQHVTYILLEEVTVSSTVELLKKITDKLEKNYTKEILVLLQKF